MTTEPPGIPEDQRLAQAEAALAEAREQQYACGEFEPSLQSVRTAGEMLDRLGPERRRDLLRAEAFELEARILARRETPSDLEAARRCVSQGIGLLEQVDPIHAEPRRWADLLRAQAWTEFYQRSEDGYQAAVKLCDEAIRIIGMPEHGAPLNRADLGYILNTKGTSLAALGGADALAQAVAAYDEAITLRRGLDLTVPLYRDDLAGNLTRKGVALQALGGADALARAVAAYDEAIAIQHGIDLTMAEFADAYARSLTDFSETQQKRSAARGVIASLFDEAQAVLRQFLTRASFPDPQFVGGLLYCVFCNVRWRLEVGEAEVATDLCDEALGYARNLEALGLSGQRQNREILFGLALEAYRRAGMIQALPEVIWEHLDPAAPGSAADSAAMHENAADALRQAIQDVIDRGRDAPPDLLSQLLSAQQRLLQLHTLSFGGTAVSARLRARLAAARGESGLASAILDTYLSRRPNDPDGWLARAEWRVRIQRPDGALAGLKTGARLVAERAGTPTDMAVGKIADAARMML